jgi:group II intron reverse transcriptase/maturase
MERGNLCADAKEVCTSGSPARQEYRCGITGADETVVVMKLLQWQWSEGFQSSSFMKMEQLDKRRNPLDKTKPFEISKWVVQEAYEKVKANKGSAGIDRQSIKDFDENLKDNLYKLWNRMSSGTYFPPPVKAVKIPKKNKGVRVLGIPTVADRIAQQVAREYLEPQIEPLFHPDSYGYRPDKSAHDAVAATRKRCWRYDWVLEFDIVGLFDNINHAMLMEMVEKHAKQAWVVLYIKRWLTAPFDDGGTLIQRTAGTPQGGVISPLLANLFLHYVFDSFMAERFKTLVWERYADDGVVHCVSKAQAHYLKVALEKRFAAYGLELHPDKTKIVYCGQDKTIRRQEDNISFDFLGFTFRPRSARSKSGVNFTGFLPAIANKAKCAIRQEVKRWKLQHNTTCEIEDIAKQYNSKIRGWMNYYGEFYPSQIKQTLGFINSCLCKWVKRKYKNKCGSWRKAGRWLVKVSQRKPELFYHWTCGVLPTVG